MKILTLKKMAAISEDKPIVNEIIDMESKINDFLKTLMNLFDQSGCARLITMGK